MRRAFYFGAREEPGHFLWPAQGYDIGEADRAAAGIPWTMPQMDTTLLKNRKIADIETGEVHWTCASPDWFAFFWWDRGGDERSNSNSGFYVQGFALPSSPTTNGEIRDAFEFAVQQFPDVVVRQKFPLKLAGLR